MHSDPVADMLTRIRNGCGARMQSVSMPWSRQKERIAEVLKKEGYIDGFGVRTDDKTGHQTLEVAIRYDEKRQAVIGGIKRMSSPGLRRYYDCDSIPKIRNGLGVIILTTSKGLMTDREARRARIGGEALCSVW